RRASTPSPSLGTAAEEPSRGARSLPTAGTGRLPRRVVLPLGLAYGVWVAGWAGAALVGTILAAIWWLSRRAPGRLRHAKPGRPSLGGRMLPHLAGPWVVTVSLTLAGLATAAGTHLALNMPFHDVTETLGTALRGWVPQVLCLPAMARLVLALGQPGIEQETGSGSEVDETTVEGPSRLPDVDEDGGPGDGPPSDEGGRDGIGPDHDGGEPGPEGAHEVEEVRG
ncbi:DUF3367 domain-containing protein, partial [Nocardiopsis alba]